MFDAIPTTPVAGRYRLTRAIGAGANGRVFAAVDEARGRPVALKRLTAAGRRAAVRFAREVATLRALDVRGVVRILDAGEDDEGAWLVMELIDGAPFPGGPTPAPWAAVERPVTGLLRTLEAVHRFGFVHRDIKPSNVLVDPAGAAVLIDFGLATGPGLDPLTVPGSLVGTQRYLPPEAWTGSPPGRAADLFATGVMIAQAVLGPDLLGEGTLQGWIGAARSGRLRDVVVASAPVPSETRRMLAALLDPDPARRLAGAWVSPSVASVDHPIFAPPALPAVVLERLRTAGVARWSIPAEELPGGPVEVAIAALRQAGVASCVLGGANEPLESLERAGAVLAHATWGEARAAGLDWILERSEVVFVIHEADLPDRETTVLLRVGGARVLRVRGGPPRRTADRRSLAALFVGTDPLLQTQADAAEALYAHTGGVPMRVRAQLARWVRDGIATPVEGGYRLDPSAIPGLAGGTDGPGDEPAAPGAALSDLARTLVAALALGRPGVSVAALAASTHTPTWRVERLLRELARRALAHSTRRGWRDLGGVAAVGAMDPPARDALVRRLLRELPPSHPARWRLAVLAGDPGRMREEALAAAETLRAGGQLGRAMALLEDALVLARVAAPEVDVAPLAEELAHLALCADSASEVRRARAALARPALRWEEEDAEATLPVWAEPGRVDATSSSQLTAIDGVLCGAQLALEGDGAAALSALVAPTADARWESWRIGVRVRVLLALGRVADAEAEVDALLRALPPSAAGPRGRALALLCLVRYRQSRFREAARISAASARLRAVPEERLSTLLNGASAHLEAGAPKRAEAVAARVLRAARRLRLGVIALRAAWIVRVASYRRGVSHPPDDGLVDAAEAVGNEALVGVVALQEAAFAWRSRDHARAVSLARRAATSAERSGAVAVGLLARALLAAEGVGAIDEVLATATTFEPAAIAAQAAWLLPAGTPGRQEVLARRFEEVPRARRGRWLEVGRVDLDDGAGLTGR